MTLHPYYPKALAFGGLVLIGMGLYFIFLRPPLLPEDARYMNSSVSDIRAAVPGLADWLQKVFWVMGGYIIALGLLTVYVAFSAFQGRERGAFSVIAFAGLSSIGWMAGVNFLINSDFRWLLLLSTIPWAAALILYRIEEKNNELS